MQFMFESLRKRVRHAMWRRSRRLTRGESAVMEELLRGDDVRLRKFRQQWLRATTINRCFGGVNQESCEISWEKSFPSLGHRTLAATVRSDPLTVVDVVSKRELSVRMIVKKGGVCSTMIGTANDGNTWPLLFEVDGAPAAGDKTGLVASSLPPMADQSAGRSRLLDWMGVSSPGDADAWSFVEVFEPVTDMELENLARRIEADIPPALEELLRISNGLLMGELYLRPAGELELVPRQYGAANSGILIAEDILRGISDGFTFMPLSGPDSGSVRKCDMYAELSEETTTLGDLFRREFERLPLISLRT